MTGDEKKELIAWIAMHIRGEVARALQAREAALADAIGKALAEERVLNRELVTRMLTTSEHRPDNETAVFDLRDERRRRNGHAA